MVVPRRCIGRGVERLPGLESPAASTRRPCRHERTNQPGHSGPAAGADPTAIRAELPEELGGRFDTEYQAALDAASASCRLDQLHVVLQAWWQLVWARRSPRHTEAIAAGQRLLRGEEVEPFPVDLDGLGQ